MTPRAGKSSGVEAGSGPSPAHLRDAEAFLAALVATPSPTGSAGKAVDLFVETARGWGFAAWTDEAGNGIASTLSRKAIDARRPVVLLGHIDTVAGVLPVRVSEEPGPEGPHRMLWGRGSVDAKGPLVSLLAAARALHAEEPDAAVLVVAAPDEEGPSEGARHLLSAWEPSAIVIGEPGGSDGVTLGYRGKVTFRYRLEAPTVHTGAPVEGVPDMALEFYEEARSLAYSLTPGVEGPPAAGPQGVAAKAAPGEGAGESVFARVDVRLESMAAGSDGKAERADLLASVRTPPGFPTDDFLSGVRNFLGREKRALETLDILGVEEPVLVERSDPVASAYVAAIRSLGLRPVLRRKTGTSDMCIARRMRPQVPVATYGPGDSKLDHTPEERLDLADFSRSVHVTLLALRTLARSQPA